MGKPINDSNEYCPLWRKKVDRVCHTCPWYQEVKGVNPNTGDNVSKWECAIAMFPMLQIETSQQMRQAGAATESFRNELTKMHADSVHAVQAVAQRASLPKRVEPKLINGQIEQTDSE